jgi:hypothetical protein
MSTSSLQDVQRLFNRLLDTLHDCWYLNEHHPGSYSAAFEKLLKQYYKLIWNESCDMLLTQEYFDAHRDTSKITKAHQLTNKLHLILCKLAEKDIFGNTFFTPYLFGMNLKDQEATIQMYNRYMQLYTELSGPSKVEVIPAQQTTTPNEQVSSV